MSGRTGGVRREASTTLGRNTAIALNAETSRIVEELFPTRVSTCALTTVEGTILKDTKVHGEKCLRIRHDLSIDGTREGHPARTTAAELVARICVVSRSFDHNRLR